MRSLFITRMAASLFAAALTTAVPASAGMTPADEAGMRAYRACLDETQDDEAECIKRLGGYEWYPKNETSCEIVTLRTREAIAGGAQAEWQDLFYNERCARLDMMHNREAAAAGDTDPVTSETSPEGAESRRIFVECLDGKHWNDESCFEKVGRHQWYDEEIYCATNRDIVEIGAEKREIQSWKLLFYNERCHRRGVWHYEPAQ